MSYKWKRNAKNTQKYKEVGREIQRLKEGGRWERGWQVVNDNCNDNSDKNTFSYFMDDSCIQKGVSTGKQNTSSSKVAKADL